MRRVLLIDNYDSFTYNLVQALAVLGADVTVHRHDKISVRDARALEPTHVVISPGPGRPEGAGISMPLIEIDKRHKRNGRTITIRSYVLDTKEEHERQHALEIEEWRKNLR